MSHGQSRFKWYWFLYLYITWTLNSIKTKMKKNTVKKSHFKKWLSFCRKRNEDDIKSPNMWSFQNKMSTFNSCEGILSLSSLLDVSLVCSSFWFPSFSSWLNPDRFSTWFRSGTLSRTLSGMFVRDIVSDVFPGRGPQCGSFWGSVSLLIL